MNTTSISNTSQALIELNTIVSNLRRQQEHARRHIEESQARAQLMLAAMKKRLDDMVQFVFKEPAAKAPSSSSDGDTPQTEGHDGGGTSGDDSGDGGDGDGEGPQRKRARKVSPTTPDGRSARRSTSPAKSSTVSPLWGYSVVLLVFAVVFGVLVHLAVHDEHFFLVTLATSFINVCPKIFAALVKPR